MRTFRSLLLLAALAACGDRTGVKTDSLGASTAALPAGEHMLAVPDGSIWYKVSGSGTGAPVILLHGGPGFSSVYLKSLDALGDDRPVVRYDQLGGGKSEGLTDTAKFNIAHFVAELDSLRSALGYERAHILGHSWGTILAVEYYKAHPERVISLTLGSPALDIPQWEKNARRLVTTLPDSAQRAIRVREAEKKYDAPDYQAALNEFYGRYVWRQPPPPADLDSLMKTANQGIYMYMQGPSEFTIVGTLKQYDAKPFLKEIKVPTLFTVGEFDEADPPTVRRHAALVPGARVVVIPGAAHITTWDNPAEMTRVVREFLREVDAGKAAPK
ncbi:MAG TPA: proline iminopeptidase-family hydrolase [Gemmatimonadaceae bacterium]|nr:proline iminopeptidase-family hydrolase [Gemmatimonadaceae bacterium]